MIRDTFAAAPLGRTYRKSSALCQEIDRVLSGKKKFKSVPDMIDAIYQQNR